MRGIPVLAGVAATVALVALAVLSAGCSKLKARDNLNKGVNSFDPETTRLPLTRSRLPSTSIRIFRRRAHSATAYDPVVYPVPNRRIP